jgi:hypothetical protein
MRSRQKYQVFISSTYADLHEEREAVTWAILTARHIPVGMEAFTATDDRGWQTIESVIDRSDYYVLLLAGRYGSTDRDGLSWTQREYEYAASKEIPILVFIRSKSSITANLFDDDPKLKKKLDAFKKRVKEKHLCVEWTTKEELVSHVSSALRNHIIDDEDNGRTRPGWYRGDELPAAATLDEFARLSSEAARLKSELESVRSSMAESPSLALVERNQMPVAGSHKIARTFKIYHPALTSLAEIKQASYGGEYLVLNTLIIFELGVQNIGKSLAEHVLLDATLMPISGFLCGMWDGQELLKKGGRLSNNTIRPEYKNEYPESARLESSNRITLRFRIERVPIGGAEYIPALFVVGVAEDDRAYFSLKYNIAGSVGGAVSGECDYEIEFNGSVMVDEKGRREEEAALRKDKNVINLYDILLHK